MLGTTESTAPETDYADINADGNPDWILFNDGNSTLRLGSTYFFLFFFLVYLLRVSRWNFDLIFDFIFLRPIGTPSSWDGSTLILPRTVISNTFLLSSKFPSGLPAGIRVRPKLFDIDNDNVPDIVFGWFASTINSTSYFIWCLQRYFLFYLYLFSGLTFPIDSNLF